MSIQSILDQAMTQGQGILHLKPNWVPRYFCRPGRRLRLHPDDYYALDLTRGAIDERWFSSTTKADNGPGTPEDEGLSYIAADENGKTCITLLEAVQEGKAAVIGQEIWEKYRRWPMYSKFFDNQGPLPHHIHQSDAHAAKVGQMGKPEMYFYPAQYNPTPGEFAFTFFGIQPHRTKQELKQCLMDFTRGDNHITDISQAYRLTLDTGWDVPTGVLHAPGSLCTYEPQFASDVFSMYQSVLLHDHTIQPEQLWKNNPPEVVGDFDYLLEILDWELNVDPYFARNRMMTPQAIENTPEGCTDEWICYKNPIISAKRLTVAPGRSVTVRDGAAYGLLAIQGHGAVGPHTLEAPVMIRFGQMTCDEYFVTDTAAKSGVTYRNDSKTEPLVVLRHFSDNPELQQSGLLNKQD